MRNKHVPWWTASRVERLLTTYYGALERLSGQQERPGRLYQALVREARLDGTVEWIVPRRRRAAASLARQLRRHRGAAGSVKRLIVSVKRGTSQRGSSEHGGGSDVTRSGRNEDKPMTLTELLQQSGGKAGQASGTQPAGTIRNAVSYPRPGISATRNGQPVTLIASADIVGMSPAEKYIDENGRLEWAGSEEFTITDEHVVPHSRDQRQRLYQGSQSQSESREHASTGRGSTR